ncbi:PREDICTED: coiled-coil domain-containing protein 175 [Miniopterus natalensis]|uniref:coiled-coil domain-containing protein 175 n=1 Tax=Miniopterus natalensis TaxID=291302 RepID=UPI0007A6CB44|nr:PREDICTED: coiled-coil domain-containing protein 175 [Miniopterus natalensis]
MVCDLQVCDYPGPSEPLARVCEERSLQSDYFKCNEEARIFLKDMAIAVKKLEEMRKDTIELLEIESMELSRLYFLLETLPSNISTELEEFVTDARRLNLLEIKQLQRKITRINNKIEFLKTRVLELKENNQTLGKKQEVLAKEYEKIVLLFNHMMGQKAATTIFINETFTKINLEKEELELHKKYIRDVEEEIEKERLEYLKRKQRLSEEINKYEQLCEFKKQDAYHKKRELDKLRLKEIKVKDRVTTNTVIISDHTAEITELQEVVRHWEQQLKEIKKSCSNLENKIDFFKKSKIKLEDMSNIEKNEFLMKIKEVAEMLHKAHLENKTLQDKLHTLSRQYKIVLQEEEQVFAQKKKLQDENHKQLTFIAQKEKFLSQRKVDIKNMEEGLVTLTELHRATKEVYRKNVRILNENLERETQRCIITQWKIACLLKKRTRWLGGIRSNLQEVMDKIEAVESRRQQLLDETSFRKKEIVDYLAQIDEVTLELKHVETNFIVKEKLLIEDLTKYEEKFVKEVESTKIKEDELVKCLPLLQVAEEACKSKHRELEELNSILTAQKQEQNLLNDYISQMTRDFSRYLNNMDKLKQELQQLQDQESDKTKSHFEILKNLENEIYTHDLIAEAILLENRRLKEYIVYIKSRTEEYTQGGEAMVHISSDLSWQLVAHCARYLDLWAEFQVTMKEFVNGSEETLQEIKNLVQKLNERDEKIERISIWLQGNLAELRFLSKMDVLADETFCGLGKTENCSMEIKEIKQRHRAGPQGGQSPSLALGEGSKAGGRGKGCGAEDRLQVRAGGWRRGPAPAHLKQVPVTQQRPVRLPLAGLRLRCIRGSL